MSLNRALADVDSGQLRDPVEPRAARRDYLDRWLAEHGPRIEPGTLRRLPDDVRRRIKPVLGHKRLDRITTEDVRSLRPAKRCTSARTTKLRAQDDQQHPRHAASRARARARRRPDPVQPGFERRPARPAQAPRAAPRDGLPAHPRDPAVPRRLLARLPAAGRGADRRRRPDREALALTWGDIDWQGAAIVIARASKRTGTGSTKGDRSARVEIGPRLLKLLEDHARRPSRAARRR